MVKIDFEKISSDKRFLLLGISIIVIIALFVYFSAPSYEFHYEKGGVLFASNEAFPNELMDGIRSEEKFVISFKSSEDFENSSAANHFLIPFLIVLIGNDKNVVSVIQVFNEQGVLISCETNLGDYHVNETISAEECSSLLASDGALISLNQPNGSLSLPLAVFSETSIEITPKGSDSIQQASYTVLGELFPNYRDLIEKANWLTSMVTA